MTEDETKSRDELFSRLTTMREAIDGVLANPDSIEEITKNLAKVSAIVRGKNGPAELHGEEEEKAFIDAATKSAPPGVKTTVRRVDGTLLMRMIMKTVNTLQMEPELQEPEMVWLVLKAAAEQYGNYLGVVDGGSAMVTRSKKPEFDVPVGKGGNA